MLASLHALLSTYSSFLLSSIDFPKFEQECKTRSQRLQRGCGRDFGCSSDHRCHSEIRSNVDERQPRRKCECVHNNVSAAARGLFADAVSSTLASGSVLFQNSLKNLYD